MVDCAGEYRRSFVAERMQQANHPSAERTRFPARRSRVSAGSGKEIADFS
jgi:hypothetical protein